MAAGDSRQLRLRLLSGAGLAAVGGGAVWLGGPLLALAAAGVAAVLAFEWHRLTGPVAGRRAFLAVAALAPLAWFAGGWPPALLLVAATAAAGCLGRGRRGLCWSVPGALLAALAPTGLVWLRAEPDGLALVATLVAVVVATDVGAWAVGRSLGGPRLAPRTSPGKTWSGAVGGVLAAVAAGLAVGGAFGLLAPGPLLVLSVAAGMVAMAGDLAISAVKRRAGVKDAGRLIPGHGGALDRFDSMVAVVLATTLAVAALR